jgi:hypothetical protein
LLVIANRLPTDYELVKAVLIYVAPAATISAAGIWAIAGGEFNQWRTRRELAELVRRCKVTRDAVYADPHSSQALKDDAQKKYEDCHRLVMQAHEADADHIKTRVIE